MMMVWGVFDYVQDYCVIGKQWVENADYHLNGRSFLMLG